MGLFYRLNNNLNIYNLSIYILLLYSFHINESIFIGNKYLLFLIYLSYIILNI